jgi:hypothetical protein
MKMNVSLANVSAVDSEKLEKKNSKAPLHVATING